MSIKGKVSQEDREKARIERERVTNPVDSDPGMDDFDWDTFGSDTGSDTGWGDSSFGDGGGFGSGGSGGFGDSWGTGGGFGSPWGTGGGFGNSWGTGGGFVQPEQKNKNDELEDKILTGLGSFFKGFVNFTKDFSNSFKTFNYMNQLKMGRVSLITSVIISVIGVLLTLFGFGRIIGLDLMIGGLTSLGLGVIIFMTAYDKFNKNGGAENPEAHPQTKFNNSFEEDDNTSDFSLNSETDFNTFSDMTDEEDDEYRLFDDDDDDDDFLVFDDDEDSYDDTFSAFDDIKEEGLDDVRNRMENTLKAVENHDGMYTRLFLYEKITECLAYVNPSFDKTKVIPENSEEFDAWDAVIQNSAELFKPKGNDIEYPYLISAKEKIFYYLLEVKRVKWLKNINQFVNEIVNIYAYDPNTGVKDTSIYGIAEAVGDRIYIKIMKGETAMVSVKDAYLRVGEEIKDPGNYMPIVLGLDEGGNIIWRDFKDINSILVTGMPRSGKTWFVQSVLTQMMFYLKPSELHFYILDPKDQISDFKAMKIPHIRKFVSSDEDILRELRHIVRVEGPRRKKIIGDAGFVNIWDFKKKNPDVDIPLLYVVIDEVITLAERMDSDTKDEFQGLLLELVSQLPALGIRIFMIPHVVKDQVLKKSITDLIPCRVSVRGDTEHIEKSVGVKNFPHRLVHQGDMAVRFNNDEPKFVHSAVLSVSNEGNQELFQFLTKFWSKLDPEGCKGSLIWAEENGGSLQSVQTVKSISQKQSSLEGQAPSRKLDITLEMSNNRVVSECHLSQTKKLSNEEISELVKSARLDDDDDLELFD